MFSRFTSRPHRHKSRQHDRIRRVLRFEHFEDRLLMATLPVSLPAGGIVSASISQRAEQDLFTFQGRTNEVAQLVLTRTSATDANFKPYIKVFAPSNTATPISSFWYDQDKQLTLPKDGTYLVQVRDDNLSETGDYKLGLEKVNPASPNPLATVMGGIVNQQISQSLEKDQFTFQGSAGEVVQLVLTRTGSINANFKPYIKVYGLANNGTPLRSFWYDQDVQFTLPKTGTYLIQVQDDNLRETGTYKIGLEKVNPASPNPISLVTGGIVEQAVSQSLEKDQFTFKGSAGEVVQLVLTRTGSTNANFKPYIKVYELANNGTPLKSFWYDQDVQFTLPKTGTYLVQVQDDNLRETGTYKIGLEKVNPASPNPISLVTGGIVQQAVKQSLEKDQFVFQGSAGDVVQLVLTRTGSINANFKPYIKVYELANNGTPLKSFWYDQDVQVTLPKNGTYLVQVQDDNLYETGTYKIGLEKVNPASPSPISLVNGVAVRQQISQSLEKDQFVFSGRAGEVAHILVTRLTNTNANFKPFIKVYALSNTGTPLASFWYGQNRSITLPRDGTYLVQVQDDNLYETGDYEILMRK